MSSRKRSADPDGVRRRLVVIARIPKLLEHKWLIELLRDLRMLVNPECPPLREGDIALGIIEPRLPVLRVHMVHPKVDVRQRQVRLKVLARAAVEGVVVHAQLREAQSAWVGDVHLALTPGGEQVVRVELLDEGGLGLVPVVDEAGLGGAGGGGAEVAGAAGFVDELPSEDVG
jgi:hypothetical protein